MGGDSKLWLGDKLKFNFSLRLTLALAPFLSLFSNFLDALSMRLVLGYSVSIQQA